MKVLINANIIAIWDLTAQLLNGMLEIIRKERMKKKDIAYLLSQNGMKTKLPKVILEKGMLMPNAMLGQETVMEMKLKVK